MPVAKTSEAGRSMAPPIRASTATETGVRFATKAGRPVPALIRIDQSVAGDTRIRRNQILKVPRVAVLVHPLEEDDARLGRKPGRLDDRIPHLAGPDGAGTL